MMLHYSTCVKTNASSISIPLQDHPFYPPWKRIIPPNHITLCPFSFVTIFLIFLKTLAASWLFSSPYKVLTTSLVSSTILQTIQFKRLANCILRIIYFSRFQFRHDSRFFHQEAATNLPVQLG